jgi:ubiquinone/menaquinone biosynthesis C-methylase UbiE
VALWGRVFAAGYDVAMAGPERAGLRRLRRELLSGIGGDVVEIGGGTGANLAFYGSGVRTLTLVEPEAPMARRLEAKLADTPLNARVVRSPAEELPFPDQSFDHVVSTLVLCTVSDPARSLSEIRRVLRSSGSLLFIEHVRAEEPRLARWQDRLHGFHCFTAHGCHCNRDTASSIEQAGLRIDRLLKDRMRRTLPIVSPLIVGAASAG